MAAKPLRTLGVHSRVPPVRVSDEGQWFIAAGFRREEAGTGRTTRSRQARPRRAVPTTTRPRRRLITPTDPAQEPFFDRTTAETDFERTNALRDAREAEDAAVRLALP